MAYGQNAPSCDPLKSETDSFNYHRQQTLTFWVHIIALSHELAYIHQLSLTNTTLQVTKIWYPFDLEAHNCQKWKVGYDFCGICEILGQGFPTCGPRTACGPRGNFMRPA